MSVAHIPTGGLLWFSLVLLPVAYMDSMWFNPLPDILEASVSIDCWDSPEELRGIVEEARICSSQETCKGIVSVLPEGSTKGRRCACKVKPQAQANLSVVMNGGNDLWLKFKPIMAKGMF